MHREEHARAFVSRQERVQKHAAGVRSAVAVLVRRATMPLHHLTMHLPVHLRHLRLHPGAHRLHLRSHRLHLRSSRCENRGSLGCAEHGVDLPRGGARVGAWRDSELADDVRDRQAMGCGECGEHSRARRTLAAFHRLLHLTHGRHVGAHHLSHLRRGRLHRPAWVDRRRRRSGLGDREGRHHAQREHECQEFDLHTSACTLARIKLAVIA